MAVYGTLRAGGRNDMRRWAPGIQPWGTAWLQGQLYDMGLWPGLVLAGAQQVLAEVYPLHPALEQQLDRIEAIWPMDAGEYQKRVLTVRLQPTDGGAPRSVQALVYEALPAALAGCPPVPEGDWLAWFQAGKPQA